MKTCCGHKLQVKLQDADSVVVLRCPHCGKEYKVGATEEEE